jgi:hypothetical protein
MRINFAHYTAPSTTGRNISFAIFEAKADSDALRDTFLGQLVIAARGLGLKVESAAMVYEEHGQLKYWGEKFAVSLLEANGVPRMTNYMDLQ